MLKVPSGTIIHGPQLGQPQVQRIISIFSDQIRVLGIKHRATNSTNSDWLYDQPPFSPTQVRELDEMMGVYGCVVSTINSRVNALVCYRSVTPHTDDKIRVEDHSVVFVPLFGHAGAEFIFGEGQKQERIGIQDGKVLVFDQDTLHGISFPPENSAKLKFGLSFFADKKKA